MSSPSFRILVALPFAAVVLVGTAPALDSVRIQNGRGTYSTYCRTCHGDKADGKGPLADSLRVKVPDLIHISERMGGTFPREKVFKAVESKGSVESAGSDDMPQWGECFTRVRGGQEPEKVKEMLASLVEYLESIQAKPAEK